MNIIKGDEENFSEGKFNVADSVVFQITQNKLVLRIIPQQQDIIVCRHAQGMRKVTATEFKMLVTNFNQ